MRVPMINNLLTLTRLKSENLFYFAY